jgi:EmrB/QacA subfamily drug resistance transporter
LPGGPVRQQASGWIVVATVLGTSMVFIDGTVVNVALPVIQRELGAGLSGAQWVVEAYLLPLAALILTGGALGDRLGRRRVFIAGIAFFAAASALCGLSRSLDQLVAARAVQGVGGALLTPGSLAIISASFEGEARGRAIGTWSGWGAVTAAIGPLVGGWIIGAAGWRWVFYINLPIAAAAIAITLWRVPESRGESGATLDWPGTLLATAGLGAVVYGLVRAGDTGFGDTIVWAALGAGVAALAGFVAVEWRSPAPMLPLRLFRSRVFTGANLLTLFLYSALNAVFFFLPFDLIYVQRYTPLAAGAALAPATVILFGLSRWAGGLAGRGLAHVALTVGPAVAGLGFALFVRPGVGSGSYWTTFFPAVVVLGFGLAMSVAPLTTVVLDAVDTGHAGVASGVNNAVSRVAAVLAIAVFGVVASATFRKEIDRRLAARGAPIEVRRQAAALGLRLVAQADRTPIAPADEIRAAFVVSFRVCMLASAALALASSGTAWWLVRRDGAATRRARGP